MSMTCPTRGTFSARMSADDLLGTYCCAQCTPSCRIIIVSGQTVPHQNGNDRREDTNGFHVVAASFAVLPSIAVATIKWAH